MKTIEERFWAKVGPETETGCREWTANLCGPGYGQMRRGGPDFNRVMAHRLSYELHYGEIPEGLCVLHKCDNKKCVNPEHLFLGTHKDNVADMVAKKRHAWRKPPPWTKLSNDDISDIRVLHGFGMTRKAIAKEYGVSRPLISVLVSGKLERYRRESP